MERLSGKDVVPFRTSGKHSGKATLSEQTCINAAMFGGNGGCSAKSRALMKVMFYDQPEECSELQPEFTD